MAAFETILRGFRRVKRQRCPSEQIKWKTKWNKYMQAKWVYKEVCLKQQRAFSFLFPITKSTCSNSKVLFLPWCTCGEVQWGFEHVSLRLTTRLLLINTGIIYPAPLLESPIPSHSIHTTMTGIRTTFQTRDPSLYTIMSVALRPS